MRVTESVIFGVVGLVSSVNATEATGNPVLAKRQTVTVSSDGCTAVCNAYGPKGSGVHCIASCDEASSTKMPSTSTSTSTSTLTSTVIKTLTTKAKSTSTTKHASNQPTMTSNSDACQEICSINEAEGEFACIFECNVDFSTTMPPTPISDAALHQRTVASNSDDCQYTCAINNAEGNFDCGFSCYADLSATIPPTPISDAALYQRTVVSAVEDDCTATCWDLMPGTECDILCSSDLKTEIHVPSKAARIAHEEVRQNGQARQVQEARLARKFGDLVARNDNRFTTVSEPCPEITITSTIVGMPELFPLQARREAESVAGPALLSQASAALSAAQEALDTELETATALDTEPETTTTTSTSVKTKTKISISMMTVTASADESETDDGTETTTESITSSKTTTASKTTTTLVTASETTTESSTSSETITEATTTTGSLVSGAAITTFLMGTAPQCTVSTGLILSLLVGLAASVIFWI